MSNWFDLWKYNNNLIDKYTEFTKNYAPVAIEAKVKYLSGEMSPVEYIRKLSASIQAKGGLLGAIENSDILKAHVDDVRAIDTELAKKYKKLAADEVILNKKLFHERHEEVSDEELNKLFYDYSSTLGNMKATEELLLKLDELDQ